MQVHNLKTSQINFLLAFAFLVLNIFLTYKCFQNNASQAESVLLQLTASSVLYLIALITLIQYRFFKEDTYLYYVTYVLINVLYFTTMSSFDTAQSTALPDWFTKLRYYLPMPLLLLSYYLYTLFAISFLSLKTKDTVSYLWLKRFCKLYLILFAIALITFLFPNGEAVYTIRAALLIICMPVGFISITLVFIRVKNTITRILCIGSLFFLIGSILGFIYAGKAIPFISDSFPFNRWIFYTELGTILEIIMFSSSFAYRNKLIADDERLANQKLLHIRDEIARDLHDDIGASLSNINILSELAKRNAGNASKVNEYLGKAGEDIQHVSESLNDIVWNINPQYDNFTNLVNRMKRYGADMMEGKNIAYTISFPDKLDDIKLEMDKRRNFFLIFKEAINNLAKYSHATHANISLHTTPGKLHMEIEDNGKGFDAINALAGNGLKNMKQRAELCSGHLEIISADGKGTRVSLTIPI